MNTLRATLLAALTLPLPLEAALHVYFSPNDIESAEASGITGTSTEDFSSGTIGSMSSYHSTIVDGTFTTIAGTANFRGPSIYGASNGGTQLAVEPGGSVSLDLNTPVGYYGFYFTAGDPRNQVEIYSGSTLLLAFDTQSLIDLLPRTTGTQVEAIDGSKYDTIDYYGQPVTNSNPNEPYVYLHFFGTNGTTFDRMILRQELGGGNFENDNHTIRAVAPTVPGSFVPIPSVNNVPEPSVLGSLAFGLLFLSCRRSR